MILATATKIAALSLSGAALTLCTLATPPVAGLPAPLVLAMAQDSGYLGVSLGTDDLTLTEVYDGHAAAAAGLQPGDRILVLAGHEVRTYDELVGVLAKNPPGTTVGLVFLRGDKKMKAKVTLGAREVGKLERIEEESEGDLDRAEVHEQELRRILAELQGVESSSGESGYLGFYPADGEAAVVGSVVPGSPAEQLHLQPGDRIVAIDDVKIESLADLRDALAARPPGTRALVVVLRGEEKVWGKVELGRADAQEAPSLDEADEVRGRIEEEIRKALGAPLEPKPAPASGFLGVFLDEGREGAVVSGIVPGSPAEKAELRAGDRILAVSGRKIPSGDVLRKVLASRAPGDRVDLEIARGDQRLHVELPLGANPGPPSTDSLMEEPVEAPRAPEVQTGRRERIEHLLQELQRKSLEQSRRWAATHDERIQALTERLREHARTLDGVFRKAQEGTDLELLDPATRERMQEEIQRWAQDRAKLLRENADRVRRLEQEHAERWSRFLQEIRARQTPAARDRFREARRRLEDVERGFESMLRQDVAPEGRQALESAKKSLHSLQGEMDELRRELDNLRRKLQQSRTDG